MNGVIYIEIAKFAQSLIGEQGWEGVIRQAGVPVRRYYRVADYPDEEAFALLGALSVQLQRPVPELLGEYEQWPAVGVNWCNFGDSGHEAQPEGLVIENYVMRSAAVERNWAVKCIVDPRRTLRAGGNPHYFEYADGAPAVDENKQQMAHPGRTEDVTFARLRLNHYVTKSKEERARKLARPVAFDGRMKNAERVKSRDVLLNEVRDETIQMYVPALKQALAQR